MHKFQVIAHRGLSSISPENTLIAFKRAIEIGVDAIETDVQMTKDGELVLIHDEKLNRTTNGKGYLKDYTLGELRKLDAGNWFSPTYQGERIPTIDEFFQLVYNTNLWVNIEIKMGFVMYPGIEEKLIEKIKEYKMEKRVVVSSFNHYSVSLFRRLAPEIKTAVLYVAGLYKPWDYANIIGATSLHPHKEAVYKEIVEGAHRRRMKIYPYTVDDREEMIALINMGVDGIMTNVPDKLILVLREL